jgi:voltage-gated potassium channel Kch
MWWGVVTLTTIGYGDVYPVTPLGKCFAAVIGLLGVGTIALPAAILGSAFKSQVEEPANPAGRFSAASAGRNSLGLREACAEYVNRLWISDT